MLNDTLTYLFAQAPLSTVCFSGAVAAISTGLPGPGGLSGSGFPLPRRGFLTGLHVWDGTVLRYDHDEIAVEEGDRLSVYCQNMGSDFTVKARLNGNSTNLQVTGVPFNSSLYATVELVLLRD